MIIEFLQDWGNKLLEGTNKPLADQEPKQRNGVSTRSKLACECPAVSSRCVDQQWPAVGSGTLNSPGLCPFEGSHHYLAHELR